MIRVFDVDFMFLDLAFTIFWIALLYRRGYIKPLLFGVLGIILNFIIDYGIWYSVMGIRTLEGLPIWMSPLSFFVYFSITYGMVQYSYVQVMFSFQSTDENSERWRRYRWSALLFGGWLVIGFISFFWSFMDSEVTVIRYMNEQRFIEVAVVIAMYALLAYLASRKKFDLNLRRIAYIFSVGFFVHFSMEFTLLLSGIRKSGVFDLVFNSFLEFNMGTPLLYLMLVGLVPII
ncbi:MAG: hypothetical protein ACFFF9_05725 [Candidatus Thorarchaeota archaeon]